MTPFAIRKRLRALVEKRFAPPPKPAPPPPAAPPAAAPAAPPAAPKERNWELSSQAELVDHIIAAFHEPLRRDLPALADAALRLERAEPAFPRGLADTLATLSSELSGHMLKEETVLFPVLRTGARGGSIAMPIRMMQRDHDDHDANLARIREQTADLTAPANASEAWQRLYADLRTLETALHRHIYLEDNILFARAAP